MRGAMWPRQIVLRTHFDETRRSAPELGGLETFQPKGNAALDFSYDCAE